MLYTLYDAKVQALSPMRMMAEATRLTFTNPYFPLSYTPFGRAMAAGSDVLEGLLRERERPQWGIESTPMGDGEARVSIEVARSRSFCDLLHFKREGAEKRNDPKILLVAPMSGHYATLLRGTVKALIQDHEVYVTDWQDASQIPYDLGHFGLDEYIDYLLDFMRHLAPDLSVMAVCQPAPIVLSAVSLLAQHKDPAEPKAMILMGGPIDTSASPTIVTTAAENRPMGWFEHNCVHRVPGRFPGAGRKVYPGFLQLRAFMAMNPARHATAHAKMFNHLVEGDGDSAEAHRRFYDEYMAVMDVTADFYLETVRKIFKEHALPRGEMDWRGEIIKPQAITNCALMTVEGELDDISAPGQTIAAHDLCSGIPAAKHLNHLEDGVGHYGIFNGRRWRESVKPAIGAFIREQLQAKDAPKLPLAAKPAVEPGSAAQATKAAPAKSARTKKATPARKKPAARKTATAKPKPAAVVKEAKPVAPKPVAKEAAAPKPEVKAAAVEAKPSAPKPVEAKAPAKKAAAAKPVAAKAAAAKPVETKPAAAKKAPAAKAAKPPAPKA